jgi:hypothetical protein
MNQLKTLIHQHLGEPRYKYISYNMDVSFCNPGNKFQHELILSETNYSSDGEYVDESQWFSPYFAEATLEFDINRVGDKFNRANVVFFVYEKDIWINDEGSCDIEVQIGKEDVTVPLTVDDIVRKIKEIKAKYILLCGLVNKP